MQGRQLADDLLGLGGRDRVRWGAEAGALRRDQIFDELDGTPRPVVEGAVIAKRRLEGQLRPQFPVEAGLGGRSPG